MKELLSNILDEAFDVKSNLGQLLEIRSSSLEKLEKENVLEVMTNFPVEMVRIFFNGLEKAGFKIKPDTVEDYVHRYAEYTKMPFSSNKNPWLDRNNRNEFEFTDEATKDYYSSKFGATLKIVIEIAGSVAKWAVDAHFLRQITLEEAKPIRLTNLSAGDFANDIAKKAKKLVDKVDPNYQIDYKVIEKAKEGMVKNEPPLVKKLKPLCRIYLLDIVGEKDHEVKNIDMINILPSFTKLGIGWPDEENRISWDTINKNWDNWEGHNEFRHFTYKFQTELFLEAIPKIIKRIKESNLIIMRYYLDEKILAFHVMNNVERSARFPRRDNPPLSKEKEKKEKAVTYAEIEDQIEKNLMEQATKLNDKAKPMTLEGFKHYVIANAIDPTVKKEPKK